MKKSTSYDVIVIGVGGMGSAAVAQLARRGQRVLGLEGFDIPHRFGSSHGVNRIIRLAYYEHSSYVPLLRRSYELWSDLENDCGEQLLHVTGSVDAGPENDGLFKGSVRSCREHGLEHEVLDAADLAKRFPGYRLAEGTMACFQPAGGFLRSERCIVRFVMAAQRAGAFVRAREKVLGWEPVGDGVTVTTQRGTYEAARLVITAGAWTRQLLPNLSIEAVPERQVLGWFQPIKPELFRPHVFPVFNLQVDEGRYYGFPVFEVPGFKIGRYHHLEEVVDPDRQSSEISEEDEEILRVVTRRYFPDADGPTMALSTCMFTNTPDEHFLIDTLPEAPQVSVAAGFSGHGFKFCSVVGEILADLAIDGDTSHDISKFRLTDRPLD